MLNSDRRPLSYAPSARNRSRCSPRVAPRSRPRCVPPGANGNASWPAATGVCVVKTVVAPHRRRAPRRSASRARADRGCAAGRRTRRGLRSGGRRRADAQRAQRADAADAEHDLLLQARLAIAAVEPRRELAIRRRVLLEVGVEQVAASTRPTRTRHTAASTVRSPSGTAVTHGVPSGVTPARPARRPSSAVRSAPPASRRRSDAGGSSPAGT